MSKKTLKIPATLFRSGSAVVSEDKKSVRLSISSEEPYLRYDWFDDEEYWEVLDHSPAGADVSRLKNGAALLFNHKRDVLLGTLSNPTLENGRCYVDARISEAADVASYKTKVDEGILKDTSVGYEITDKGICIGAKDEKPIYKFKFAIHEASLVTIPADPTVGVGRQRAKAEGTKLVEIPISEKETIDTNANTDTRTTADIAAGTSPNTTKQNMKIKDIVRKSFEADTGGNATTGAATAVDLVAEKKTWQEAERKRVKDINDYVCNFKITAMKTKVADIARKAIEGDVSFRDFKDSVIANWDESRADIESDEQRSQIEVIGERGGKRRGLTLGEQFVNSKDFKERAGQTGRRRIITLDSDMSVMGIRGKVQLAQRAGFNSVDLATINVAPQQQIIALGMERLTIMDLVSPGTTSAAAIPYPKESSQGTLDGVAVTAGMPRAGMVGERGVKPTWEPDITTDVANVKKIAVITKVPDEFLSDFPGFKSYVDQRLPAMVDFQAENQFLYGDGIGNNIKGVLTNAGVLTRAYATDWFTTIRKAITDIEATAFFTVDALAMHPYDWETASLEKDVNGQPYAGGPFYIPYGNGVFMEMRTFWGKPVVVTVAVTAGQPVVGCWKLGAQYFMREGMRLETTNSNEDDFKRNLIAVRAEERLALATYRPACFLEVTGGPART